jgi:hypothetical protein
MAQSIKQRIAALGDKQEETALRELLTAVLADLAELRTELTALRVDYVAGRAEVVKLVTDYAAGRAEVVKLVTDVTALVTREKSFTLSDAGLVISGTNTKVKAAKTFTYIADGTVVVKAADTDMAVLAGTIADGSAAGWAFYGDSAGTLTTSAKTADAADAAAAFELVKAVAIPAGKALIGWLVVTSTGATFVGATTALDAGTAADLYISTVGPAAAPVAVTAVAPAAATAVAPASTTASEPAALTLTA